MHATDTPTQSPPTPGHQRTLSAFTAFIWRDLFILLCTVALWMLHLSQPLQGSLAILCGVLTGVCALQLHEWAHVWGAFRANADIYLPSVWWHPFLFSLDHTTNTREQFLAVSLPAFAATALYICVFWGVLPGQALPGKVALIMGSVTATLTLLIEVPLFIRVYLGHPLPPVALFKRPPNTPSQAATQERTGAK